MFGLLNRWLSRKTVKTLQKPAPRSRNRRKFRVRSVLSAPRLRAVRLDESGHAGEFEVGCGVAFREHRGARARAALAAVDPGGLQAHRLRGRDVVVEALGGMQDVVLAETDLLELAEEVTEVAEIGLVGADVLGRHDLVERDLELLVALGEGGAVDV